jgi:N-carbamoyl-L-amino-acid hydrolase
VATDSSGKLSDSEGQLLGDAARLVSDLQAISDFGRVGPSAVTRLAFTPEDNAAHAYVEDLMNSEGLQTRYDAFGNLFGRRPGEDPQADPVMTGSHLDGPPNGGLYDGTIGVIGALEAIRLMNAQGTRTRRAVEIAAIRCEHLDRFGLSCIGSRVLSGKLNSADLHELRDGADTSLAEAVRAAGHRPDEVESAHLAGRVDSFVELHIEQGRVLEDIGEPLGVVTSIAGPSRFHILLAGVADHSGGTPMAMRRDAFSGAAEIALELERMCRATDSCVGTIGIVRVQPGAVHTIPGIAELWVDIRGVATEAKRELVHGFRDMVLSVAKRRHLEPSVEVLVDEDPVPTAERVVESLCATLSRLGFGFIRMPSGGGHDSQHLAAITDVGMLFVPSVRGISHVPDEYTEPHHLALGAGALAQCLVDLAGRA